MNLNTKILDNVIVVNPEGRIDIDLSMEIEKEINNILQTETGKHLLFNFNDVEYLNSSGIRLIISIKKMLEKTERHLKLCNINNAVKMVFEVLELEDLFEIFKSEEEALASFKNLI